MRYSYSINLKTTLFHQAASIFRDIYPESGVYVGENDGWIDVPPAFSIVGWCVKQLDTDEDTNYK